MPEQVTSNYLLACPFCGGTPRMATEYDPDGVKWHYITCLQCGARIRGQWHSPGNDCPLLRAEVRDQWNRRASVEPPAVDVAPIAKLTVRDGLVQRAGLYAPGLPDGDHDVFPVPLSPKGELRPHVLAEPPDAARCHADPIYCTPECRQKTCDHAWDFNHVPPQCAFGCGATREMPDARAVTKSEEPEPEHVCDGGWACHFHDVKKAADETSLPHLDTCDLKNGGKSCTCGLL